MRVKSIIMVEGGYNRAKKKKFIMVKGIFGVEGGHDPLRSAPAFNPNSYTTNLLNG
jgi:hypothetical protein